MKSKITGRVEEWWKPVCQKHNCEYYLHEDYPSCSYCTCPYNCIVVDSRKYKKEMEEYQRNLLRYRISVNEKISRKVNHGGVYSKKELVERYKKEVDE